MPYIHEADRLAALEEPCDVGELTYKLYMVCKEYVNDNHIRYQDYAHVIGALECTKMEFYRRILAPYEDKKIQENGDV
jgi:hypothetical protein